MTFTNAPDSITSLRTVLNDTAAWTYGIDVIHYPLASAAEESANVYAVLADEDGDSASIMIYAKESVLTTGQLRQLAELVADQIRSDRRSDMVGLLIPDRPQVGQVGVPSDYQRAGNTDGAATDLNVVDILVSYSVL